MNNVTWLVIAKAPIAGKVKTRLCPPCTFEEAASIAQSALSDTLRIVRATPAERYVVALEGAPGPWLPAGFEVFAQRGDSLAERLTHAFADVFSTPTPAGPVVLVGMDTPQITSEDLIDALAALRGDGIDSTLGMAVDGGWWCIGFNAHAPHAFDNVVMSNPTTGAQQLQQLKALGLAVALTKPLLDVDTFEDALTVAAVAPSGEFAHRVRIVSENASQRATNSMHVDTVSQ